MPDMPMTPRERAAVARQVARNQRAHDKARERQANDAAKKVMQTTGDRDRAARVRAQILGRKAPVAATTAKAARSGKLPSTSLADTGVRSKVQAAGVPTKIPGGGLVGQFGKDLVNAGIYTPVGIYQAGKAAGLDVRDTAKGHPTGKRTAHLGKQVAKSTVETVKHPLRHPGDTFLLGLGAVTAGAGTVTRLGAAGAAAKEASTVGRSAARAALTRPGHKGGSLLRRPVPELRHHRVGDLDVTGVHSAAPGVRHIEKAVDRARATHAEKAPVETANIRTAGVALGQNRRVAEAAGRAHPVRLSRMGRKLTRPQQQALRVWGQNLTPDEKIAKYKQDIQAVHASDMPDATKASMGKALADKIALTEAARPYFKPGTSELADTFVTPRKRAGRKGADAPQLRKVAEQAQTVAGDGPHGRERALIDAGVLEPEQAVFRTNAPGRLALGAEWTTAAEEAVKRLNQIDRERSAVKGEPTVVPGKVVETKRPRTREEAQARLDALDQAIEPIHKQIAAEFSRSYKDAAKGSPGAAMSKEEWVRSRHGKKGAEFSLPPEDQQVWELNTFGEHQGQFHGYKQRKRSPQDLADDVLSQLSGGHGNVSPDVVTQWLQEFKAQGVDIHKVVKALRERDDLRYKLSDRRTVEEVFGGEAGAAPAAAAEAPDYGHVVTRTREPDKILPPEVDEAGVKALADLDKRERDAFALYDRGGEPTLTGAEEHQGRFRVPDVRVKEERRRFFGPGVYRGGQPRKPPSLRYRYTGGLESTGRFRVNVTEETARSALEGRHYTNLLELRGKVLSAGRKQRPPDTRTVQWVPVREKQLTPKQRRMLEETAPVAGTEAALETTAGEAAAAGKWQQFLEDLFPEREYGKVAVGAEVPNVVWVPRQFLHDLNAPFVRQNPGVAAALSVFDTTMNLVKFGVIPLKTAYLTANAAGNFIFNALQQGVFLPRNWATAVKLLRDPELGPIVREVMGSGGMRSLVDGNPKGVQVLNHAMHAYGHAMSELMAEPMMRASSLAHEADRFGFKGVEGVRRLFNDPELVAYRDTIVRRGNRAIVDYDRMGPVEKAVARRVLFIYPWVKGATMYAGQFLLEHPVQSAVYSQMAEVGRQQAEKDIGQVPSWAEGTFKVGGSRDFPLTVNPAQISPLGQAAEIAQVGMGLVSPGGGSAAQLGSLLHPALQSGIEAAYKRDTFTGAPLTGSTLGIFAKRSAAQIAPVTLAQNIEKAGRPPGERAFPMTKTQAILRNTVGSFMPRTANREALNDAARREQEANLTPGQRARRKVFREREQVWQTMKANDPSFLGPDGELRPEVKQAYNREATVEAARAEARHQSRGDSLSYYRDVAVREARLLEHWGQVPPGFANTVRREVENVDLATVKAGVGKMRRDLMGDAYRNVVSEGSKYLKSRGG